MTRENRQKKSSSVGFTFDSKVGHPASTKKSFFLAGVLPCSFTQTTKTVVIQSWLKIINVPI